MAGPPQSIGFRLPGRFRVCARQISPTGALEIDGEVLRFPSGHATVAAFAASILTAPRSGRPGTAPAFAATLAEVPENA